MKRILVVGAVVLLTACAEDAKVDQVPEAVRPARIFQVVAEGASNELEFVGRVEAAQTVDVSFEVGGPLAQLPVLEGQTVPAGALIAALDPTDVDAEIGIQEAELARLDAELGSARNRATQRSVTAAWRPRILNASVNCWRTAGFLNP